MKVGCLTINNGEDAGKKVLLKNLSVFEAGRSQGNHVFLKDSSVACSHFRVYRSGQQYSIYDLGTKTGTQVNGENVDKMDLASGDNISAGACLAVELLVAIGALSSHTGQTTGEPRFPLSRWSSADV